MFARRNSLAFDVIIWPGQHVLVFALGSLVTRAQHKLSRCHIKCTHTSAKRSIPESFRLRIETADVATSVTHVNRRSSSPNQMLTNLRRASSRVYTHTHTAAERDYITQKRALNLSISVQFINFIALIIKMAERKSFVRGADATGRSSLIARGRG